jgi:hypothetical protein
MYSQQQQSHSIPHTPHWTGAGSSGSTVSGREDMDWLEESFELALRLFAVAIFFLATAQWLGFGSAFSWVGDLFEMMFPLHVSDEGRHGKKAKKNAKDKVKEGNKQEKKESRKEGAGKGKKEGSAPGKAQQQKSGTSKLQVQEPKEQKVKRRKGAKKNGIAGAADGTLGDAQQEQRRVCNMSTGKRQADAQAKVAAAVAQAKDAQAKVAAAAHDMAKVAAAQRKLNKEMAKLRDTEKDDDPFAALREEFGGGEAIVFKPRKKASLSIGPDGKPIYSGPVLSIGDEFRAMHQQPKASPKSIEEAQVRIETEDVPFEYGIKAHDAHNLIQLTQVESDWDDIRKAREGLRKAKEGVGQFS